MDTGRPQGDAKSVHRSRAGGGEISYEYPRRFRAGEDYVEIGEGLVSVFLEKLSGTVGPAAHESLAREVWVS
jgi:hypothetical protein